MEKYGSCCIFIAHSTKYINYLCLQHSNLNLLQYYVDFLFFILSFDTIDWIIIYSFYFEFTYILSFNC